MFLSCLIDYVSTLECLYKVVSFLSLEVGAIIKVLLFFALNLIHALELAIFFVRELFFTLPEILWCVYVILTHFLIAA